MSLYYYTYTFIYIYISIQFIPGGHHLVTMVAAPVGIYRTPMMDMVNDLGESSQKRPNNVPYPVSFLAGYQ